MRCGIAIILICALMFIALSAARDITPTPDTPATVETIDSRVIDPSILTPWGTSRCLTCTDLQGANQSNIISMIDERNQILTIYAYYEAQEGDPPATVRKPVMNSMILVELTNSTGLRQIFRVFTDRNGSASFSFSEFPACVDFRIMYCPYCAPGATNCAFNLCADFLRINTSRGFYSNVPGGITNANDIATRGSMPTPLNTTKFLPSMATRSYCAPPPIASGTPALCLPLIIIFTLLGGALYASGRNPFSSFNLGSAHVGKHIRYQARGRGVQFNVQQAVQGVQQGIGAGKAMASEMKSKSEGGGGRGFFGAMTAVSGSQTRGVGSQIGRAVGNIRVAAQSARVTSQAAQQRAAGGKPMSATERVNLFTQQMDARLGGGGGGARTVVGAGGQVMTIQGGGGQRASEMLGPSRDNANRPVGVVAQVGSFVARLFVTLLDATIVTRLFTGFSGNSLFSSMFTNNQRNAIMDRQAAAAADASRNRVNVPGFGNVNVTNSRELPDGTRVLTVETGRGNGPGQTHDGQMTLVMDRNGNVVRQNYVLSVPPAQLSALGGAAARSTTDPRTGNALVMVEVTMLAQGTRNAPQQQVVSVYAVQRNAEGQFEPVRNPATNEAVPLRVMNSPGASASVADRTTWLALTNATTGGAPHQFALGTNALDTFNTHQEQCAHADQIVSTYQQSSAAARSDLQAAIARDPRGAQVNAEVTVSTCRDILAFNTADVHDASGRSVSLARAVGESADPVAVVTGISTAFAGVNLNGRLNEAIEPGVLQGGRTSATRAERLETAATVADIITRHVGGMTIAEATASGTGITSPERLRDVAILGLTAQLQQNNPTLSRDAAKAQAETLVNRLPDSSWTAAATQIQTTFNNFLTQMSQSSGGPLLSNAVANVTFSRLENIAAAGSQFRLDGGAEANQINQGAIIARAPPDVLRTLSPETQAAVTQLHALEVLERTDNQAHAAAVRGDTAGAARLYAGGEQALRDFALAATAVQVPNPNAQQRTLIQDGLANLDRSNQISLATGQQHITASTEETEQVARMELGRRNDIMSRWNSGTEEDRGVALRSAQEALQQYRAIGATGPAEVYQHIVERMEQYNTSHPPATTPPTTPSGEPPSTPSSTPNPQGTRPQATQPTPSAPMPESSMITFPPLSHFNATEVANRETAVQSQQVQHEQSVNAIATAVAAGHYAQAYDSATTWHEGEVARLRALGLDTRPADEAYRATITSIDSYRTDSAHRRAAMETATPEPSARTTLPPPPPTQAESERFAREPPISPWGGVRESKSPESPIPPLTQEQIEQGRRKQEPHETPAPTREEEAQQTAIEQHKLEQGLGTEAAARIQYGAIVGRPISQADAVYGSIRSRFESQDEHGNPTGAMTYRNQPDPQRAYEANNTYRAHSYEDFIRAVPSDTRPFGEDEIGLPAHVSPLTGPNTPPPPPSMSRAENERLAREHPPTAPWGQTPAPELSPSQTSATQPTTRTPPSPPPEEPPAGGEQPPSEPPPTGAPRTTRRTEPTEQESESPNPQRRGRTRRPRE